MSVSMRAVLHRNFASAGTSHEKCCVQRHHKREPVLCLQSCCRSDKAHHKLIADIMANINFPEIMFQ